MIVNLLNYNGVVIGTVEVPDSISERDLNSLLSAYNQPPKPIKQLVSERIHKYRAAAPDLLVDLYADNTIMGITTEQSAQMFADFKDVLDALREGAFPTALHLINLKTPSGFVTQNLINTWKDRITAAL